MPMPMPVRSGLVPIPFCPVLIFICFKVATNLERTGFGMSIGMSMGIGDSKPAPLLKAKKKKQKGMATNPERTGIGMGIGEW